jgi:hypothetical protein
MSNIYGNRKFLIIICICLLCACFENRGETKNSNGGNDSARTPNADTSNATASPAATANDAQPIVNTEDNNRDASQPDAETPDETDASDDASAQQFKGTAGVVEKKREGIAPVVLRAVRTSRQKNFDRVVFEFEGTGLPGYHIEYIDRPVRQCGSGNAVRLRGDAWLRVRLTPSQAHTEAGEATVKDRERVLNLRVLKEMKATCDFEADVEWVFGLASPKRYRVLELSNPARLVVDIKH